MLEKTRLRLNFSGTLEGGSDIHNFSYRQLACTMSEGNLRKSEASQSRLVNSNAARLSLT